MALPLIMVWLCVGSDNLLAGEVVRGTLAEPITSTQLKLLPSDESLITLPVNRQTLFFVGTQGHLPIDPSQLAPGTKVSVRLEGGVATVVTVEYSWFEYPGQWVDERVLDCAEWSRARWGPDAFLSLQNMIKAILAILVVGLICGVVSSLVVSNRMAFFSDALAHCAFAGFSLGLILHLMGAFVNMDGVLGVMIVFGAFIGLAIAYVREQTTLANDTVIGVFFAGSMGLGAILLSALARIGSRISPENFLFGDPFSVTGQQLVYLTTLLAATVVFLLVRYNAMVLASFNPSLARSRRVRVRLGNYLFIVLLALVVNICLNVVGALLINALLILPAATAGNLARNLRAFFWLTVGFSLSFGLAGFLISVWWQPTLGGRSIPMVSGGVIVLVGVSLFFLSIFLGRWVRGQRSAARAAA
jgi:zinc transport system permease protein